MKKLALLAVLLPTLTFAAPADTFTSPTAGFSVTKPTAWVYTTADENAQSLAKLQTKDAAFDEAIRARAANNTPIVMMTKYPEPYDDLNPSFKINLRSMKGLEGKGAKEILGIAAQGFGGVFKDFKLVVPPTDVVVDGVPSAFAAIEYTLEAKLADGKTMSLPTRSEMWIIPRGNYFLLAGVGMKQGDAATQAELHQVVGSLKLQK